MEKLKPCQKTAVLISIRPQWVELIANGQKTLEVRKSHPAIEPPFTCYIYCTRGRYADRVSVQSRTIWDEWRGRIIGEFACDTISAYPIPESLHDTKACRDFWSKALLKTSVIWEYSGIGRRVLYGWRVADLQIYKNPLNLSALRGLGGEPVKRAPQSWRYVRKVVI